MFFEKTVSYLVQTLHPTLSDLLILIDRYLSVWIKDYDHLYRRRQSGYCLFSTDYMQFLYNYVVRQRDPIRISPLILGFSLWTAFLLFSQIACVILCMFMKMYYYMQVKKLWWKLAKFKFSSRLDFMCPQTIWLQKAMSVLVNETTEIWTVVWFYLDIYHYIS